MGKHRVGLDINRGFKSEMRETVLSLASQSTSYNSPAWIFFIPNCNRPLLFLLHSKVKMRFTGKLKACNFRIHGISGS